MAKTLDDVKADFEKLMQDVTANTAAAINAAVADAVAKVTAAQQTAIDALDAEITAADPVTVSAVVAAENGSQDPSTPSAS